MSHGQRDGRRSAQRKPALAKAGCRLQGQPSRTCAPWQADEFGNSQQVVALVDRELRELRDDELAIEVHAAGVGLPDALMVRRNYPAVRKPPIMPGPGHELVGKRALAWATPRQPQGVRVRQAQLNTTAHDGEGTAGVAAKCRKVDDKRQEGRQTVAEFRRQNGLPPTQQPAPDSKVHLKHMVKAKVYFWHDSRIHSGDFKHPRRPT